MKTFKAICNCGKVSDAKNTLPIVCRFCFATVMPVAYELGNAPLSSKTTIESIQACAATINVGYEPDSISVKIKPVYAYNVNMNEYESEAMEKHAERYADYMNEY
jgi:hypothetical protein